MSDNLIKGGKMIWIKQWAILRFIKWFMPKTWASALKKKIPKFIKKLIYHEFHTYYSQHGQDYIIINEIFKGKRDGYFLDMGAADGKFISNTYALEKYYGWNGICVEPNKELFEGLNRNRKCITVNKLVYDNIDKVWFLNDQTTSRIISDKDDYDPACLEEIETITLDNLLRDNKAPEIIEYFSLDVEGAEYRILESFSFDYIFLAMTIESPTMRIQNLLKKHNYIYSGKMPVGVDGLFLHKSIMT